MIQQRSKIVNAGGFADVFKGAVLSHLFTALRRDVSAAPWTFVDVYAGQGRYDLAPLREQNACRAADGVDRLWRYQHSRRRPPVVTDPLNGYMSVLQSLNRDEPLSSVADSAMLPRQDICGRIRHYPGSAEIARHFQGPHDRIVLNESEPTDYTRLLNNVDAGRRGTVVTHCPSPYEACRRHVPPAVSRNGIQNFDTCYLLPSDEFVHDAPVIADAVARWPTAMTVAFYPVVNQQRPVAFLRAMRRTGNTSIIGAEVHRDPQYHGGGSTGALSADAGGGSLREALTGVGCVVFNASTALKRDLDTLTETLHTVLNPMNPQKELKRAERLERERRAAAMRADEEALGEAMGDRRGKGGRQQGGRFQHKRGQRGGGGVAPRSEQTVQDAQKSQAFWISTAPQEWDTGMSERIDYHYLYSAKDDVDFYGTVERNLADYRRQNPPLREPDPRRQERDVDEAIKETIEDIGTLQTSQDKREYMERKLLDLAHGRS